MVVVSFSSSKWVLSKDISAEQFSYFERSILLQIVVIAALTPLTGFYFSLLLFVVVAVVTPGILNYLISHSNKSADSQLVWLFIIVFLSLFFLLHIHMQTVGVAGCCAWEWGVRDKILSDSILFFSLPFFMVLAGIYFSCHRNNYSRADRVVLPLFMISSLLFSLASIYVQEGNFEKISRIIQSPIATSFYTDALGIDFYAEQLRKDNPIFQNSNNVIIWLKHYTQIPLNLHSNVHPPGPILFYYVFIALFGDSAPLTSGLFIGLTSSLGPLVMFYFSGLWGLSRQERLMVSGLYAVTPAVRLFYPGFDQIYPLISMALIYFWIRSVRGNTSYSLIFGSFLFIASMMSYKIYVIGTFLASYAIYVLHANSYRAQVVTRIIWITAIALITLIVLHGLLYLLTGYDAYQAFTRAYIWQSGNDGRPRSIAQLMNLYDFSLGLGFIPTLLSIYYFTELFKARVKLSESQALSLIGLITIIILNFSNLVNWETARVWILMQPLILIPSAIVLINWGERAVYVAVTVMFLHMSAIASTIILINA